MFKNIWIVDEAEVVFGEDFVFELFFSLFESVDVFVFVFVVLKDLIRGKIRQLWLCWLNFKIIERCHNAFTVTT